MTPFSPWVLEWLLPAARKKGIPVHVATRNLSGGFEPRALEIYPLLAAQAKTLGYSGYGFYETANLYTMNSAGRIMPKLLAAEVLRAVSNSTKTT